MISNIGSSLFFKGAQVKPSVRDSFSEKITGNDNIAQKETAKVDEKNSAPIAMQGQTPKNAGKKLNYIA